MAETWIGAARIDVGWTDEAAACAAIRVEDGPRALLVRTPTLLAKRHGAERERAGA